jgi:hypothetical protein
LAPFELILSRPPPNLSVESAPTGIEDTPTASKLRFLGRIIELVPSVQQMLAESQAWYKRNFDRSVKE